MEGDVLLATFPHEASARTIAQQDGSSQSNSECYQLQCGNRCVREGTRVVTRGVIAQ